MASEIYAKAVFHAPVTINLIGVLWYPLCSAALININPFSITGGAIQLITPSLSRNTSLRAEDFFFNDLADDVTHRDMDFLYAGSIF